MKLLRYTLLLFICTTQLFFAEAHSEQLRILLIGPPGSGKGTQASYLSEKYNIPHISSGDMLRQEVAKKSTLGLKARWYMSKGLLMPDSMITRLVKARLQQEDCQNGYILDGVPRKLSQAENLARRGVVIDHVIVIDVPEKELVKRLSERRIHEPSGRTYHTIYNPPKKEGLDDVTGEKLTLRKDDTLDVITKRLTIYKEETLPVLAYYKSQSNKQKAQVHVINGVGEKEDISLKITKLIS